VNDKQLQTTILSNKKMTQIKLFLVLTLFSFCTITFAQKISLKKSDGIIPINTETTEQKHKGKEALKVKAIKNNKTALVLLPIVDFAEGTIEFEMAAD